MSIAVTLLVGGIILFTQWLPGKKKLTTLQDHRCYLYQGLDEEGVPVNHESIELAFEKDATVTGVHELVSPYHARKGRLKGAMHNETIDAILTFDGEEVIWDTHERAKRFQMFYRLQGDRLYVGYQQVTVPRYRDYEGVYRYEDSSYVMFNTEEFYLNQVECGITNALEKKSKDIL